MIKPEVHFVEDQHLLVLSRHHRTELTVCITIVNLNACKLGVLDSHVNSAHCKCDCVSLVRFKRTRYSKLVLRVSVQNVDELLLLSGSNHDCTTFGICCQVLSRHDPSTTSLPKGFLMNLNKVLTLIVILENDNAA